MATELDVGLARITIAAPGGRIDLALPDHVPLAELMPTLLHHIAESVQDPALGPASGWRLRRADGSRLVTHRSLAAQEVRDGEVLYVVPADESWPEPEADDLALAVADAAQAMGGVWQGDLTRRAGLSAAVAILVFGVGVLLAGRPPWLLAAAVALVVAATALTAGLVLSRISADSRAGAAIAGAGLPYAFTGGLLLLAGDQPLGRLGPPHVLTGAALLLLAALAGRYATGESLSLFVAAIITAGYALLGGSLGVAGLDGAAAAAVVAGVAVAIMPLAATLAARSARLPSPELPQTPQDLLADRPLPSRDIVVTGVTRAEELFTGILLGTGLAAVGSGAALAFGRGIAPPVLAGVVAVLLLLRARSLERSRQRIPLLVAGCLTLGLFAVGMIGNADPAGFPFVVVGLLAFALVVTAAGLRFARRRPGPQLGRLADVTELVVALSVVPLIAVVVGLFAFVRGLAG